MQLMTTTYEKGSPNQVALIKHFRQFGSHVIRYSSFEWSGLWRDLCIEQKLMRPAKSGGGISRGRFRNSKSQHRCWILTLSHLTLLNQLVQENTKKKKQALHRDLAQAQRVADGKAFDAVLQWLEERKPFDHDRETASLVAFSTGLVSTADDDVNPEQAFNVGGFINATKH